ncbi:MAG: PDZ domain-containing protein [Gammaproteobacteria bacterium]
MTCITKSLMFAGALILAPIVSAQPPAATPPPAERGTDRSEIEQAQRDLAEAARKFAELSAAEADRWMREFEFRSIDLPPVRLGVILGPDRRDGLVIRSTASEGPAEKAGLKDGDLLLEMNGKSLAGATTTTLIDEFLRDAKVGDVVTVKYRRGSDTRTASVTLDERPAAMSFAFGTPDGMRTFTMPDIPDMPGIAALARLRSFGNYEFVKVNKGLGDYFNTDRGLLVVGVGDKNPLTLKEGDVILSIDGREPESATHAARILRSYAAGEEAELEIMRQRRKQTLKVTLPDR